MKNSNRFNLTEWFNKLFATGSNSTYSATTDTQTATFESPIACVSVVIPALNEANRIGDVVRYALSDPATAEVIVIDDSSIDDTARLALEAGATVVTSSMLGKGASMRDGVALANHNLVVYLDGDLANLSPQIITKLTVPLLSGAADFVKAHFSRSGGRVTELTAKPMLKVFFPELAHYVQPLGGIVAARKGLLQALTFEDGYGVDVGLLIDAYMAGASIQEISIGAVDHESQALESLAGMANEVSRVIFDRARKAGRLHFAQISAMFEAQRQAAGSVSQIRRLRKTRNKLLLIDMDDLVLDHSYCDELAKVTGLTTQLRALESMKKSAGFELTPAHIAQLFQFVHREQFERVARTIPIKPFAVEYINMMRRRGFTVGLISKGYFVAADIIRRRVFADLALAHCLEFDLDICNGKLNPDYHYSEKQIIDNLRNDASVPALQCLWTVQCESAASELSGYADRAFAVDKKQTDCFANLMQEMESEIEHVSRPLRRHMTVDDYIGV
jgi:glucosyl-3-phosphoglycerate synthase